MMNSSDFKLKERVKELNCLYKLSKVAWEAKNDFDVIINKTLDILPAAMQHPDLAEASITLNNQHYSTPKFDSSKFIIESDLSVDKKKYGNVRIGYRLTGKNAGRISFL